MPHFILLQYPYEKIEIALSHNESIIDSLSVTKFEAVSQLIPSLQTILERNNKTLDNISALGINAGPGPFNTLRSIIATANALTFAKQIRLIQCNALSMLHQEASTNSIPLLHAFGQDVYFQYKSNQGFANIDQLLTQMKSENQTHVSFVGNGAIKYQEKIQDYFADNSTINHTPFNSLSIFAQIVYEKYNQQDFTETITPFYLQSPAIKKS